MTSIYRIITKHSVSLIYVKNPVLKWLEDFTLRKNYYSKTCNTKYERDTLVLKTLGTSPLNYIQGTGLIKSNWSLYISVSHKRGIRLSDFEIS